MKYIEPIKSIVLLFLVLLSIYLTFLIWSYRPDYKPIEEPQIEQITIGEQKHIQSVLKPYRMLFRYEDKYTGTVSLEEINRMMSLLSEVQAEDLNIENTNLPVSKVNEMTRTNERMTMFFKTEIPIKAFSNVLTFNDTELPEATFNRLIIDWSDVEASKRAQVLFVSLGNETVYRTDITIRDTAKFKEIFLEQPAKYVAYQEVERRNVFSLYVAEHQQAVMQYTYLIEDSSHEPFKELLFQDPGLVEKTIEDSFVKYTDWMSLITFDEHAKTMYYVNPVAESFVPISRSDLVLYTYDFINDHGGFTADYRLTAMNVRKHVTEYQMYIQGLPVYSSTSTSTRISTTWGENQIFSYRRPHYTLDNAIYETSVDVVPGTDIIKQLKNHPKIDYEKIDDIVLGYYLDYSREDLMQNTKLFVLQPSWFAISGNQWTRIMTEGNEVYGYGLE
ncbi:YycH family regulatory protein [Lysinibacillus sp. 54212]|uniref:YycH family regulatory protein n=1 Tax=Lysinibacillus sp. 54212 TaxID=3119829 RepID=UPI002FC8415C